MYIRLVLFFALLKPYQVFQSILYLASTTPCKTYVFIQLVGMRGGFIFFFNLKDDQRNLFIF